MGRIDADFMLVGSLPADTTEEALNAGAELFGDMVFALPDGETGARAIWVGYEVETLLLTHPDLIVDDSKLPPDGRPKHLHETTVVTIPEGQTELRFATWPRIDDAIESYQRFRELRDAGRIPEGVRFQVGLPFPLDSVCTFLPNFTHDFPIAQEGFEELAKRELQRLLSVIPAEDLALQWDVCYEVLDNEGVLGWTDNDGAWERFAGPARRLSRDLPDEVLLGYHFCYGTFPQWPMFEARDMDLLVRMSNYAVKETGRRVDWLHLAGPKWLRSEDERFYKPLANLEPGDARVFLGIVLPIDGERGLRDRYRMAKRYIDDFGVAMYCGFGRQPGDDPAKSMQEHREVVRAVLTEKEEAAC